MITLLTLSLAFVAILGIAIADFALRNKGTAQESLQRTMVAYCMIVVLGGLIATTQDGILQILGIGIAIVAGLIWLRTFRALRALAAAHRDNRDRPTGAVERPDDYWRNRGY